MAPTVTPRATIAVAMMVLVTEVSSTWSVAALKRGSLTASITMVVRGFWTTSPTKPAADRHLRADHALRRAAAHREAAAQHVTFGDPERSALGVERGKHPVEDPGEQLVEIQGGVEF